MYRVTFEQGNGYHCSCCRHTSTEEQDFDTKEEVQAWVNNYEAGLKFPTFEDEDDITLIDIVRVIPSSLLDEFLPQKEEVERIVLERKKAKEDKKKLEEKKEAADKEKSDRLEYEKLKKKFKN